MKENFKIIPILTCEHATNWVPENYLNILDIDNITLQSHKGWDIGAIEVCRALKNIIKTPAFYGKVSRLLIDLNRSLFKSKCFSIYSKQLSTAEKDHLLKKYYHPFRNDVLNTIEQLILNNKNSIICHISVHSFTPVLSNIVRNNDIGILYDPKRIQEKKFSNALKDAILKNSNKKMSVRMNFPYKGSSDGHTTHLRKLFPDNKYIGIEIEINQRLLNKQSNQFDKHLLDIVEKSFEGSFSKFNISAKA